MSIDIEPDSHTDHASDDHEEHGLTDKQYVGVALVLAVMTGLEVALSYAGLTGAAFMAPLLILMVLKFVTVVSLFMHLKFDSKLFSWLFYSGLLLAIFVYIAALSTFHFFSPG